MAADQQVQQSLEAGIAPRQQLGLAHLDGSEKGLDR